ncbi:MAG: coiled-coil domain-containing protein [Desulfobaccales bacterium]
MNPTTRLAFTLIAVLLILAGLALTPAPAQDQGRTLQTLEVYQYITRDASKTFLVRVPGGKDEQEFYFFSTSFSPGSYGTQSLNYRENYQYQLQRFIEFLKRQGINCSDEQLARSVNERPPCDLKCWQKIIERLASDRPNETLLGLRIVLDRDKFQAWLNKKDPVLITHLPTFTSDLQKYLSEYIKATSPHASPAGPGPDQNAPLPGGQQTPEEYHSQQHKDYQPQPRWLDRSWVRYPLIVMSVVGVLFAIYLIFYFFLSSPAQPENRTTGPDDSSGIHRLNIRTLQSSVEALQRDLAKQSNEITLLKDKLTSARTGLANATEQELYNMLEKGEQDVTAVSQSAAPIDLRLQAVKRYAEHLKKEPPGFAELRSHIFSEIMSLQSYGLKAINDPQNLNEVFDTMANTIKEHSCEVNNIKTKIEQKETEFSIQGNELLQCKEKYNEQKKGLQQTQEAMEKLLCGRGYFSLSRESWPNVARALNNIPEICLEYAEVIRQANNLLHLPIDPAAVILNGHNMVIPLGLEELCRQLTNTYKSLEPSVMYENWERIISGHSELNPNDTQQILFLLIKLEHWRPLLGKLFRADALASSYLPADAENLRNVLGTVALQMKEFLKKINLVPHEIHFMKTAFDSAQHKRADYKYPEDYGRETEQFLGKIIQKWEGMGDYQNLIYDVQEWGYEAPQGNGVQSKVYILNNEERGKILQALPPIQT